MASHVEAKSDLVSWLIDSGCITQMLKNGRNNANILDDGCQLR